MKRETADCLVMYVYGRIEGGRIVVRKEPKEQKRLRVLLGFFPGALQRNATELGGETLGFGKGGGGGQRFPSKLGPASKQQG